MSKPSTTKRVLPSGNERKLPGNTGNHFLDAFDPAYEQEVIKAEKHAKLLARSEKEVVFDHTKALEASQAFGRSRRLDSGKKVFPELLEYIKIEYPDYSLDQQLAAVAAIAALAQL
jgi:hypothetical protein